METQLIENLSQYNSLFICLSGVMLTIVESKVQFAFDLMFVVSTTYFLQNGIKKKYQNTPPMPQDSSQIKLSQSQDFSLLQNMTFKLSDRVKMVLNTDALFKQILIMLGLKLVTFYAIKQTNFNFYIEIVITGIRVFLVHMVDHIDEKFWAVEATYLFANITAKNYLKIGKYMDMIDSESKSETCSTEYLGIILSSNLFGLILLLISSAKNHQIQELEYLIKVKDDLISQLIKANNQHPLTLLKINHKSLLQVQEFQRLFMKTDQPIFDSVEMELQKSLEVSSNSMLYQVVKYNQKAKILFKSNEHDLIPINQHGRIQNQNSRLASKKFRQIKPLHGLQSQRSVQRKSQKNMHKILNHSSAVIFLDQVHKKIRGREHQRQQEARTESIHTQSLNLQDIEESKISDISYTREEQIQSQDDRSISVINQMYDSQDVRVKRMSDFSLQLFNQDFVDSSSQKKWQIQCLIIHDMFLISFQEKAQQSEISNDVFKEQELRDQRMQIEESRPFQSVYQLQAKVEDSIKVKNHQSGSKHLLHRNQPREQSPKYDRRNRVISSPKHNQQIASKSAQMKNAEFLRFEEGSLRSKDMQIESQTSTIKINITQSEETPRSFYSEVNQSKKLGSNERNDLDSIELKNAQKEMALEFYKNKVIQLSSELVNTRIFLNMVIHDMRNPINNITFALDAGMLNVQKAFDMIQEFEDQQTRDLMLGQVQQNQVFRSQGSQNPVFRSQGSPSIPQEQIKVEQVRMKEFNSKLKQTDNNSVIFSPRPRLDFQLNEGNGSQSNRQASFGANRQDDSDKDSIMAKSEQIKCQLSQMSHDIDSKKNKFHQEIQQIVDSQNGDESPVRQKSIKQESSFGSNARSKKMSIQQNIKEERKEINPEINPNEMTFKKIDSPKQPEAEKRQLFRQNQMKSKFFNNQEDSLEDDESNSIQINLKNKVVKKSLNLNLNKFSQSISFEGQQIQEQAQKVQKQNNNNIDEQIIEQKNQESKEESVGMIPSQIENMQKAMLAGKQAFTPNIANQSSYESVRISSNMHSRSGISSIDEFLRSQDIADERNSSLGDIQKIRCPSFRLQENAGSLKNLHQVVKLEDIADNKISGSINEQIDFKDENVISSYNWSQIKQKLLQIQKIKSHLTQTIELIEGCEYSSNMSANLINDLLDFAKMQQLSFKISKGWFNIVKTVENAFHVLRFEQKRKNIDLKLTISETDKQILAHIYNDESRFIQILLNFLSNSLKFTPTKGCIEVKIYCQDKIEMSDSFAFEMDMSDEIQKCHSANLNRYLSLMSQNSQMISRCLSKKSRNDPIQDLTKKFQNEYDYMKIVIEIIDNGIGISPSQLNSVFMNFNSLAEHQKLNPRGTGLGLSICKNLIEKMGGQVSVSSQLGKGTTFTVEMMALCRHGSDKRQKFTLEDQEKYFGLLQNQEDQDLRKKKAPKYNPFQSIKKSQIDKLIQDSIDKSIDRQISSQDDSWKKQIRKIKSMGKADFNTLNQGSNDDISVSDSQYISGTHESGDKNNNLEGGADDFRSELRTLRFLIANDDYFQILAIESILNEFDIYDIVKADNGLVAYEKSLQQKFDMIIMDIQMPVMNGLEAGKKIMEHYNQKGFMSHSHLAEQQSLSNLGSIMKPLSSGSSGSKAPHIYGLSSYVSQEQRNQAMDIGFKDCLMSPFTSDMAYSILQNYIEVQFDDQIDIMQQNEMFEEQKHECGTFADLIKRQSKLSKKMGAVPQFESNTDSRDAKQNHSQLLNQNLIEEEKESYNGEQLSQMSSISSNQHRRGSLSSSDHSWKSGSSRGGSRMSQTQKVTSQSQRMKKPQHKKQKNYMQNMSGIIQEENDDASSDDQS